MEDFERHAGADARVFMEFIGLSIHFLSLYTLFTPLQYTTYLIASFNMYPNGLKYPESGGDMGGIPRTNMGNLRANAAEAHSAAFYAAMWFSVIGIYVLTAIILVTLRRSWLRVLEARQQQMVEASGPRTRAVMVTGALHAMPASEVKQQWSMMYPGKIHSVRMVRDTRRLAGLVKRCFKLSERVRALEQRLAGLRGMPNSDEMRAISDRAWAKRERKIAKIGPELDDCKALLEVTMADAEAERLVVDVPENDRGASYFVLFNSRVATSTAQQVFNTSTLRAGVVAAPHPAEVNWDVLLPNGAIKSMTLRPLATAMCAATASQRCMKAAQPGSTHVRYSMRLHSPPWFYFSQVLRNALIRLNPHVVRVGALCPRGAGVELSFYQGRPLLPGKHDP